MNKLNCMSDLMKNFQNIRCVILSIYILLFIFLLLSNIIDTKTYFELETNSESLGNSQNLNIRNIYDMKQIRYGRNKTQ